MSHRFQFSIGQLLVLLAAVAFFLAPNRWWITLVVAQLFVIYVFVAALVTNIPKYVRNSMEDNCTRRDGSWSRRREKIETQAIEKLRHNLIAILLLIMLPTNLMLLVFNTEVLPLRLGLEALQGFSISDSQWKENLRDEEQRFSNFHQSKSTSPAHARAIKRLLWNAWPGVLVVGAAWIVGSIFFLRVAYERSLHELLSSIRFRARMYHLHDLSMAERQSGRATTDVS